MSNVIRIQDIIVQDTAIETIENFANEAGINSTSTAKAYGSDVMEFFNFMFKGYNNNILTSALINSLTRKNLIKFRTELINNGISGNSINRKFVSLKRFSTYLYGLGYDTDINIFNTIQKVKTADKSYEVLSLEEALTLINWIRNNERVNAESKYYYCLLAFDTGVRAEALNNLTPASFIVKENEVIIKGVDKGNKAFTKSISHEFYNDMVNDLGINELDKEEKIFNHSSQRRSELFKRAKKALGWENRNITFHSLKKGAVTFAYSMTKDILVAQKVGGHSSVTTTQTYLKDVEEVFQGAISNKKSVDAKNIDLNSFSKEELINVINSMSEANILALKKELLK